ncbi:integumentary mucin C.1 isoform X2 [Drosophila elegans]|uniref:integumentary mucin C.1 isoform X2 n=1 Tax=Drosophila elegans TaxID=30023 RepID=UPI0007E6C658|nr:integumentary mucin C.1 isoform X2 [Drosophila elegans]
MQIEPKPRCGGSISFTVMLLLLIIGADFVAGRPDVRESPFARELQPPLLQPDVPFSGPKAIDSYGNPIDALRPIDTPDGRKVVSAQGVQFEIPTYASGITEIRRPADDLLPPHIDAIAVGLEPSSPNSFTGTSSASAPAPAPLPATSLTPPRHDSSPDTTTTAAEVEVEQAHLVPLQQAAKEDDGSLPEYIRELQRQDPDIGGPVPWKPAANAAPLSVIAWDLLPPHETQDVQRQEDNQDEQAQEPTIITEAQQQPAKKVQGIVDPISHNIRLSLSSGSALSPVDGPAEHGTNAHVGSTTPANPGRFPNRQRGTAHYSTTRSSSTTVRPRSSTTHAPTTTTSTTKATTTSSTTTRRSTTTSTTTTAKPETRTTASPVASTTEDPATFYRLINGEAYAYTLPTWLQEVTDPDLDVAVTFEVPADNDQYNHTLANDLEPPFEPFVDLGNIQLTPPPTSRPTTTTSTTRAAPTTTTARTTTSTTTTTTTTTTPRTTTSTTTTTTTRRPSTQRPTKAPTPIPPTHSTQAHHHPEPPPVKLTTTTTHHADTPPEDSSSSSGSNTTPSPLDAGNPFDSATIPAWLRDFDYPDVGPGVPFDPDNFGPAASSTRSPTTQPRLPTVPPVPSAFPSKVTLPLPASSSSSSSSEEPPLVLIPPADRTDSVSSSGSGSAFGFAPAAVSSAGQLTPPLPTTNSVTPFAARFEPAANNPNQAASPSSGEPFPPSKVEYTKSDDGKVISTPVASVQRKTETAAPVSNTGKYTGGFGAPAGLLRPQSTNPHSDIYVAGDQHEFSTIVKANKARPTVNPGRYNGGFGAPTGVLSPQSQPEPRPFQPVRQQTEHRDRPAGGNRRTESRFGGPPGVLVPFDNVQRTGGQ